MLPKLSYKQSLIGVLSLLLLFMLIGCAAASAPSSPAGEAASAEAPAAASSDTNDLAGATSAPAVVDLADSTLQTVVADADRVLHNRKIKRSANLRIEVQDVVAVLNRVTQLTNQYGGYAVGSRLWYVDERAQATYNFAVPVDTFEIVLAESRRLGTVQDETVSSEDVTGQYVDLNARIVNLEATAERIRGFLANTTNLEEVLRVNQDLSQVEAQLEQLKGPLNTLTAQTAFSTINLELVPPPLPPVVEAPQEFDIWSPRVAFSRALTVLTFRAQVVIDRVIWGVVLGGPLLLTLILALWISRRLFGLLRRVFA